jgi:beta-galactosidase
MYVFHGGTTRDFMNGANMNINDPYAPQVSSYDYDAPLNEGGNPTPKYFKFREVISKYVAGPLPPVPGKNKTISLSDIALTGYAGLFENLPAPVMARSPKSFEDINQAYGFVLYRTIIRSPGRTGLLKIGGLRDYAVIFINGKQVGVLDRRLGQDSLLLKAVPQIGIIDILVENNGRINYGPYLTDNRKGILGKVFLNDKEISGWNIFRFPFNDLNGIKFKSNTSGGNKEQPAFYKGSFVLNDISDTYLDMSSFGKGFVFVNGHNLGKYWNIGPQQTIYLPACWLKKGINELTVFDELKQGHRMIPSLPEPVLDQKIVMAK